ncbi:MAG: PA3496 family putative envelope integrity protein [Halomonas sp.]
MSRDPLSREPFSPEDAEADDFESAEAVNDEHYSRSRSSIKADSLRARRQVEAWLEERRLKRAIDDSWDEDE